MRIEERLNQCYEKFSENEEHVCHYLREHYGECCKKTLEEFASDCHVSGTLLVRFAKKLGLSGYSELKARLKIEQQEREADMDRLLCSMTSSYHKMMDDLMKRDLSGLFDKLYQARRVFVYGSGSSQARACSEMKRIFLPVKEMISLHGHDLSLVLEQRACSGDLVIIISLSGESEAVLRLARALRVRHVPAVSITRLGSNTLASLCGENLYIHSVCLPVSPDVQYEMATPCFILIEYLYLSYRSYISDRESAGT